MNTTTKGAVAAGAAAVLLLGGAGTLAFWSDGAAVNGGSVSSGSLGIDPVSCAANWVYAAGNAQAGATVTRVVPGDTITKACTFTVGAAGDNISATPTVPSTLTYTATPATGAPAPASLELTVGATYLLDGVAFGPTDVIEADDDGKTLTANVAVTFPFGSALVNGSDTQNLTVALDDLTVALQQTEA